MNKLIKEMVEDIKSGLMVLFMKDTGKMTRLMEEEDLYTLMVMSTKDNGKTIRLMAMESICIQMEHNMKGIGKKISNMERARKHGQMVLAMKVTMLKGKRTVMVNSNGLTAQLMKASSLIITFMD